MGQEEVFVLNVYTKPGKESCSSDWIQFQISDKTSGQNALLSDRRSFHQLPTILSVHYPINENLAKKSLSKPLIQLVKISCSSIILSKPQRLTASGFLCFLSWQILDTTIPELSILILNRFGLDNQIRTITHCSGFHFASSDGSLGSYYCLCR